MSPQKLRFRGQHTLCKNSFSLFRKIAIRLGRKPPSPATSTPTPSVGCVRAPPTRGSWSASCATGAARSRALISPQPTVLVSRLERWLFLNAKNRKEEVLTRNIISLYVSSGNLWGRDERPSSSVGHLWVGDRNHLQQLRCVLDLGLFYHLGLQGGVWAQWRRCQAASPGWENFFMSTETSSMLHAHI